MKIVLSTNTAWSAFNFRSGLISHLLENGFLITIVAPRDKYVYNLSQLGCEFVHLNMSRHGRNPFTDFVLLLNYFLIFKKIKPNVYLPFTIKPNLYGSIAANILGIKVINNISGLGSLFVKKSITTNLVLLLYRISLYKSIAVLFQNNDDLNLFVQLKIVSRAKAIRVNGSGVNLRKFNKSEMVNEKKLRFILVSRLLWDKGIGVYVEAIRELSKRGFQSEFYLAGFTDAGNPNSIPISKVKEWESEGLIKYLGSFENVSEIISMADCVILPSYYPEGVPRVLIEAIAMSRPVITTNTSGCRDVVEDGINGFLCRPNDVVDLADKIFKFANLEYESRKKMSISSREIAEKKFNEEDIFEKYLSLISK